MYHDFDPYELLEGLARQQKLMAETINTLINNHNNLADAYYEQDRRLKTQAIVIQTLRTRLDEITKGNKDASETRALR